MKLEETVGKKCVLESTDGEKIEGKVHAASEMGVLIIPKGSMTPKLIEMSKVKSCEAVPSEPTKLRQKRFDPMTAAKVRRHLLDQHGWYLSVVNGMTEVEALAEHDGLDHSDLGHNHDGRKKNDEDETSDDE